MMVMVGISKLAWPLHKQDMWCPCRTTCTHTAILLHLRIFARDRKIQVAVLLLYFLWIKNEENVKHCLNRAFFLSRFYLKYIKKNYLRLFTVTFSTGTLLSHMAFNFRHWATRTKYNVATAQQHIQQHRAPTTTTTNICCTFSRNHLLVFALPE